MKVRYYIQTGLLSLAIILLVPLWAMGADNPAGMATFTDNNGTHAYSKGSAISFTLGPFPCQAGKTCYLVWGIMGRANTEYATNPAPLQGLSTGALGGYHTATADSSGVFTISGQITNDSQLGNGVLAVKIYDSDWKLLINKNTGAEAYVPIVDGAGNSALIAGAIPTIPATDTQLSSSLVKVTDNDLDHCYFDGAPITVVYELPNQLPPTVPASMISVTTGVFTDSSTFNTNSQPIKNAVVSISGSKITITGTINNPGNTALPAGIIGLKLNLPAGIPGASGLATPMPAVSTEGKGCIVGVQVPADMLVTASPVLSSIKNLYNTEVPITFTKGSQGSITFTPGLNIIDNRDQLAGLDQGIKVNFDETNQSYAFEARTSSLKFLETKTAGLKAFGVMSKLGLPNEFKQEQAEQLDKYIKMAVTNDSGTTVPDQEVATYIDKTNVYYNEAEDTLLIPVKHFTSYSISKASATGTTAPVESRFTAFGSSQQKTAAWQPTIRFRSAVDTATLNGISVWKRGASGSLSAVTTVKQIGSSNDTVKVIPGSNFTTGTYVLFIDNTLLSATGKALNQPTKLEFIIP